MQAAPSSPSSALLIVDMQQGLFNGAERPHEAERLLANVQLLIGKARAAGAPIYAARHTGPDGSPIAAGSAAWQLLAALDLDPARDKVFDKRRPSCFHGTGLARQLAEAGVGELHVAGLKTQYCIDTTCRAAADLGLKVVLVADAHSCMDTPALPAGAIVAHHNATLNGPFATLRAAADCDFSS